GFVTTQGEAPCRDCKTPAVDRKHVRTKRKLAHFVLAFGIREGPQYDAAADVEHLHISVNNNLPVRIAKCSGDCRAGRLSSDSRDTEAAKKDNEAQIKLQG